MAGAGGAGEGKPGWRHYPSLGGTCPACGAPAHIARSARTGLCYWRHDTYAAGAAHMPVKVSGEEVARMRAERRGKA